MLMRSSFLFFSVPGAARPNIWLVEGGQLDQVVVRNPLDWISSFAPCAQAAGYDVHLESQIL